MRSKTGRGRRLACDRLRQLPLCRRGKPQNRTAGLLPQGPGRNGFRPEFGSLLPCPEAHHRTPDGPRHRHGRPTARCRGENPAIGSDRRRLEPPPAKAARAPVRLPTLVAGAKLNRNPTASVGVSSHRGSSFQNHSLPLRMSTTRSRLWATAGKLESVPKWTRNIEQISRNPFF